MNEIAYAEKFGCHPHAVAQEVSALWWERWMWYEKAMAARLAWKRANASQDWVKDLTPQERQLMQWTETDQDDG